MVLPANPHLVGFLRGRNVMFDLSGEGGAPICPIGLALWPDP